MAPFVEQSRVAESAPPPHEGTREHDVPASLGMLVEHLHGSPGRTDVEAFIRNEFRRFFGATIAEFMPSLVTLHGPGGELRAAAGYRGAGVEKLFLETYTRKPIEAVIAERLGVDVPRAQIVEVGSLVSRGGRAAMDIIRALVPALIRAGFTWVVFTGADTVRNVFQRLDLTPFALCAADKTLLGDAQHAWGTYYDHHPIVMTGRIADGMHVVPAVAGLQ